MLPFWISIGLLSLSQGATVALASTLELPALARLRRRGWALVLPVSVIAFVLIAREAEHASAQSLTDLAVVAVPLLAALALGRLWRWPRLAAVLLVPVLFALAWADRSGLAGEAAALALTALSCVALGVLLAAVTPALWLGVGIVAMAISDTALVVSDLLQKPNNALNAAHPASLPRLQDAVFGSAVMGYGDLFIAGVLGGLLAASLGRKAQLRGAALTGLLAIGFDLLFFAVDELPATVPVALALVIVVLRARRRRSSEDRTCGAPEGPPRAPAARPPAARRSTVP
jgi:hypothetical protein